MVRFLNSTAGTEDNAVVSLMVLQVIVILLVRKRNIPLFRKKWKIQCKLPPKTKRFCPLVLK